MLLYSDLEFFIQKDSYSIAKYRQDAVASPHRMSALRIISLAETAVKNRGHTVAVLAHGLHTVQPKAHTRLAEDILSCGGALVTEYGFGVEAAPHQFVKRDKIQAGLAAGVVMLQSDESGGSLHASRAALAYGRILAVPYPTRKDIAANEKKITANLLLADPSNDKNRKLMKCSDEALRNIFVIHTREDYAGLINALETVNTGSKVPQ